MTTESPIIFAHDPSTHFWKAVFVLSSLILVALLTFTFSLSQKPPASVASPSTTLPAITLTQGDQP